MKIISDLRKKAKEINFLKAQFKKIEGGRTILFVDPIMTSFDLYTILMPYFALEETKKHRTAITGLFSYTEINNNERPKTLITEEEIKWADVIVFPMSLEDYSHPEKGAFKQIRTINPNIKIVQTVEFDFYEINRNHYLMKLPTKHPKDKLEEYRQEVIDRIESNLRAADRLIVINDGLGKKLAQAGFPDVKGCPVLIDQEAFKENIDFKDTLGVQNTPGVLFLSCEVNENTAGVFKEYIPIFEQLKKKHKNKFRLIVLTDTRARKIPGKITFEYDRIVKGPITNQFKAYVRSSADVHLVLNRKTEYSSNSEHLYTYVEHGMVRTPLITLPVSPYKEVIRDQENGFIIKTRKDLVRLINGFIKKNTKLVEVAANVQTEINNKYQMNPTSIDYLDQMFFDHYSSSEDDEENFEDEDF